MAPAQVRQVTSAMIMANNTAPIASSRPCFFLCRRTVKKSTVRLPPCNWHHGSISAMQPASATGTGSKSPGIGGKPSERMMMDATAIKVIAVRIAPPGNADTGASLSMSDGLPPGGFALVLMIFVVVGPRRVPPLLLFRRCNHHPVVRGAPCDQLRVRKHVQRGFVMRGIDCDVAGPAAECLVIAYCPAHGLRGDVRKEGLFRRGDVGGRCRLYPGARLAVGAGETDCVRRRQPARHRSKAAESNRADGFTDRGDDFGHAFVLQLLRIGGLFVIPGALAAAERRHRFLRTPGIDTGGLVERHALLVQRIGEHGLPLATVGE